MTHLDHADAVDGWLPAGGDITVGAAHLQVTHAPKGDVALRSSADPAGPALLVSRSAIRDFIEAGRTGTLDAVLGRYSDEHPVWCTGIELPGRRHRSSVLLAHRSDDLTEIRVWIVQPSEADAETVMMSFEEADGNRKRLVLTEQRIARLITATEELERLSAHSETYMGTDDLSHPMWCVGSGGEVRGWRHRSDRQIIAAGGSRDEVDAEAIDLQLIRTIGRFGDPDKPNRVLLNTLNGNEHTCWIFELHQLPLIRRALAEIGRWQSRAPEQLGYS
ncbi:MULTISPECIES: DUF397 domain-containing protein [Catenuloplanes]|uniref:Uncharacterized protein n=1 Tax=Catenuloplanes niger TaxID=587534 RepID=A0AAE4CRT0_9ACTN|nr:DUF397 domain-containing protein [Catenuloplanes niger]MDR7323291.1 hypothetical protein [Catenuloplanes niger]